MKTPKKNTTKKSAPAAKKKSGLKNDPHKIDPLFIGDEEDDDFDLPVNDLDIDGLDDIDDDDF